MDVLADCGPAGWQLRFPVVVPRCRVTGNSQDATLSLTAAPAWLGVLFATAIVGSLLVVYGNATMAFIGDHAFLGGPPLLGYLGDHVGVLQAEFYPNADRGSASHFSVANTSSSWRSS